MMAEAPELFSEQELTCSICLDLFTDPVSTPCGHNFCQACIGGYWASSAVCTCPLCKRQFDERPLLSINKVFALIADKFKQTRYGATGFSAPVGNGLLDDMEDGRSTNPFLSPPPAAAALGDTVWCDVCSGVKQPAVSSCLTCTASYCKEHLQPHYNTAFYAKHPLMDPQEALRGRTCSVHRRLMEARANATSGHASAFQPPTPPRKTRLGSGNVPGPPPNDRTRSVSRTPGSGLACSPCDTSHRTWTSTLHPPSGEPAQTMVPSPSTRAWLLRPN